MKNYENSFKTDELFNIVNSGIQTKRDKLNIHFTEEMAIDTLDFLRNKSKIEIISKFELPDDGRDWTLDLAIKDVTKNKVLVFKEQYRPFDYRYSFYTGNSKGIVAYPRNIISKHFINKDNIAICLMKQFFQDVPYSHVMITDTLVDERTMYSNRGGTYIFLSTSTQTKTQQRNEHQT